MASASVSTVSRPESSGPVLGFEDYSMYSNLSDDELMQLAIERSLLEGCTPAPSSSVVEPPRLPQATVTTPQQQPPARPRPTAQIRRPDRPPTGPPGAEPPPCPPNPPRDIKKELEGCWVSQYTTGYGKRMVAYRRMDGTLITQEPEPEAKVDPLVKAIWDGDVPSVRAMVRKKDINLLIANQYGWIPIHEAAYYGQLDCLKALLGVQPGMMNMRTLKEETALLLAVGREHPRCVEWLLAQGADPDIANNDKETPLFKATERGNPELVALLLNHGASVNKLCIQGWTALHEAISQDNVEIAEMLVKAKAKVNMVNHFGLSPLFVAAQSGHVNALRFILKHGADINSQAEDGATALYEAAKNGHENIVEFLLSQNADANKPGKNGLLPIHIAAQRGNDGIIQMLIPATSRARVRRCGISPLHYAAERNRDEVLETLIDAGYDVNAMLSENHSRLYEDRRSTALYFSVINNNVDATVMLLQAGANPNLDVFSPLLVAIRLGAVKLVTLLVEHGANVNAYIHTHPTTFPATIMFAMKYLPLLKYLMDNGCDAMSCFVCSYGNNVHPPIKPTRSRNELQSREVEPDRKTCVEFCEMISAPNMSRWAGPIIDVVLDYVGNVKLCARLQEHLDSYDDWENIKYKSEPPRALLHLCRLRVRELLGPSRLRRMDKLPIPPRLIKFLKYKTNQEEVEEEQEW
ncbi:ankyrin repeat and SOCS box protein 2-like isoform X2 [Engraulis encrasicolus]|uniref:ankyrin repeat and SOCS box protein 2-like isoform X2 n=1 Tax=Engraulis encrasicolus TaxID=184585 RepID=UPI002FD4C96B